MSYISANVDIGTIETLDHPRERLKASMRCRCEDDSDPPTVSSAANDGVAELLSCLLVAGGQCGSLVFQTVVYVHNDMKNLAFTSGGGRISKASQRKLVRGVGRVARGQADS